MSERYKPRDQCTTSTSDLSADYIRRSSDCLGRALSQAFTAPQDPGAHVQLHDAMCDYVALLKERGFAAGRVLFEVKQIVASVERPSDDVFGPAAFVESVISLCIDKYYHRWIANDQQVRSSQ